MKQLTSAQVRQAFLDFFAGQGHQVVASSSLVPGNDPTLLFTNAGMVQFKDVFLGMDKRPYKRATTAQKCMRISGKHNDLENVGPSPRHHTFFEMLGNFSFGDYFKQDAIRYAYDLLTKVYQIPDERLFYTVYRDDNDAYNIWIDEIGVQPERVYRMGPATNFWQMAETGPCGPTSEIHFDWGEEACTCHDPECSVLLDNGCERWLEIWNLVFMQFNRTQADPAHTGKFDEPLPATGVDTGMGLERIVAVLQGAAANYDTDLFTDLMDATQEILGHDDAFRQEHYVAYRVIADHTRAAAFLIADGVNPGTTGREYVPRMLIRRAWRFAHSMGITRPFLSQVADALITKMRDIYPELQQFSKAIHYYIEAEEARFVRTLDNSLAVLEGMIDEMTADEQSEMSGKSAFFLYATHGLPVEITRDLLKERGLSIDEAGFREEMQRHRDEAGSGTGVFTDFSVYQETLDMLDVEVIRNDPHAYEHLSLKSRVLAIISDGQRAEQANKGQRVEIVLAETPFYVESGGQVSDTGLIAGPGWKARVDDMSAPVGGLIVHHCEMLSGKASVGDEVTASVDVERRWDIMRNHTATHLLHASLRDVLGEHVRQKGSLVAPDRLRFDFTHDAPMTAGEIDRVNTQVNKMILDNQPVEIVHKLLDEARREGAMALFGEKYSDTVRTITVPESGRDERFSYELCGGTHVCTTAEIGPFLVVGEESSAAGVRRITAVTGRVAQKIILERLSTLDAIAYQVGSDPDAVESKIVALVDDLKAAYRQIEQMERSSAQSGVGELLSNARDFNGATLVAAEIEISDAELLGQMADWCRDRMTSGVVVLGSRIDDKARLVAKVTPDLVKRGVHAGKLIGEIAKLVGGGGGGRPDFATAGGNDPSNLPAAIAKVEEVVAQKLK
ncbi:MAG: alanine--tRNA ligase [Anaerolineae bacterium]|nr:alanine--tRNA ligase [Anaerolineae bacterium]